MLAAARLGFAVCGRGGGRVKGWHRLLLLAPKPAAECHLLQTRGSVRKLNINTTEPCDIIANAWKTGSNTESALKTTQDVLKWMAKEADKQAAAELAQVKASAAAELAQVKASAAAELAQVKASAAAELVKVKASADAKVEMVEAIAEAKVEMVEMVKARADAKVEKVKVSTAAEVAKVEMQAKLVTCVLRHKLESRTATYMRLMGRLHMRGLIEELQKVKLNELPPTTGESDRRKWSRQQAWRAILESSENKELLECMQKCLPPHQRNPRQVAQWVVNMYGHLSSYIQSPTISDEVEIVEDVVSKEQCNMLVCMAVALPVRYNLRSYVSRSNGVNGSSSDNAEDTAMSNQGANNKQ